MLDPLQQRVIDLGVTDLRVWKDHAAVSPSYPYAVILFDVADSVALRGDGKVRARRRRHQINLYQNADDEDAGLLASITAGIDGHRAASDTGRVRYSVLSTVRQPPTIDGHVVAHALVVSAVEI